MNLSERVEAKVADVRFLQIVLTVLAVPFFLVGWVAAFVWLALRWCWAALLVGWETRNPPRPDVEG